MCSGDAKLEPCGSSSIITVHPVPRRPVNNVNIKLVLCKTCGPLDTRTSEDLAVIMNIYKHTPQLPIMTILPRLAPQREAIEKKKNFLNV